jgi:hypothetical protein
LKVDLIVIKAIFEFQERTRRDRRTKRGRSLFLIDRQKEISEFLFKLFLLVFFSLLFFLATIMKDLSCFIYIVLVALPYTFSAQLRKDHGLHGFRTGKKGFGMESKIKALSSTTSHPSNPSFASIMYYNTSCDSVINQYEIFLTNTCLVDGDGSWSTMYTCGKTNLNIDSW